MECFGECEGNRVEGGGREFKRMIVPDIRVVEFDIWTGNRKLSVRLTTMSLVGSTYDSSVGLQDD